MSAAVQGVIEAITFRRINADGSPNQYQKTHRSVITVGGVRYDGPDAKPSPRGTLDLRVQNGKDWLSLHLGDTIQFFSEEQRGYNKIKGKIMFVSSRGGTDCGSEAGATPATRPTAQQPATGQAAPNATQPPSASSSKGSAGDPMQLRIEQGMILNNAVALVAGGIYPPNDFAKAVAYVRKGLEHIRGNAPVVAPPVQATPPPAAATAPAPKPAPAPVAAPQPAPAEPEGDEFGDDDIPFE